MAVVDMLILSPNEEDRTELVFVSGCEDDFFESFQAPSRGVDEGVGAAVSEEDDIREIFSGFARRVTEAVYLRESPVEGTRPLLAGYVVFACRDPGIESQGRKRFVGSQIHEPKEPAGGYADQMEVAILHAHPASRRSTHTSPKTPSQESFV